MIDIDDLLKEDNFLIELKQIKYPTKNQKIIKECPKGTYIFENNEQFKGIIKNNKLKMGIYKWPNGQQYLGDLSDNNNFIKRGTIIFPSNNKLIGNFITKENKIKNAIYETQTRKYQGSFADNKLDGRFIIKNKENTPHYFFKGLYSNGKKQGYFILEKDYNGKILQITGTYDNGRKNGLFSVYIKIKEEEKKLIYQKIFENDHIKLNYKDEEIIEKKNAIGIELPYKICCLKVINYSEKKVYICIGSYQYILIFNLNNITNNMNTPRPILMFKKADINDIIQTKDGKILLCSSENEFKLIEASFLEEEEEEEELKSDIILETNATSCIDEIKIYQEFKGLKNSKSIFIIRELSNGYMVSGDCENLILWGKFNDNNIDEYKMLNHINLTHTYCILEINKQNVNNNIILAVAQPDNKNILFCNINNNKQINLIKKIENVNTVDNVKNIMKQDNNILFIGSQNYLILINLIKFEIITKIFYEKITYINLFLKKFLLCGIIKKKSSYDYESYLSQIRLGTTDNNLEKINIIKISKCLEQRHNGSIIDGDLFKFNEKDYIITIGNDNKIIILY